MFLTIYISLSRRHDWQKLKMWQKFCPDFRSKMSCSMLVCRLTIDPVLPPIWRTSFYGMVFPTSRPCGSTCTGRRWRPTCRRFMTSCSSRVSIFTLQLNAPGRRSGSSQLFSLEESIKTSFFASTIPETCIELTACFARSVPRRRLDRMTRRLLHQTTQQRASAAVC